MPQCQAFIIPQRGLKKRLLQLSQSCTAGALTEGLGPRFMNDNSFSISRQQPMDGASTWCSFRSKQRAPINSQWRDSTRDVIGSIRSAQGMKWRAALSPHKEDKYNH